MRAHRALEAGADRLAAESMLLDAVSTLLVRYAQARPPSRPIGQDGARVARMLDDLTASLELSVLAETVGLSKFHALRIFTREVGMAPHAWRNQVRLSRASDALRSGASATEVSAAFGFADQSHFSRHFKKVHGVSPGRWSRSR